METTETEFSNFSHSYIQAMLWANAWGPDMDADDDPLGFGGGDNEGHANNLIAAMSEKLVEQMRDDCRSFLEKTLVFDMILQAIDEKNYSFSQAGHDFAMTRNHHGVGYWDRGIGHSGTFLTQAAQDEGEVTLYVDNPEDPETWIYEPS